jgi:Holliday junction resolvase
MSLNRYACRRDTTEPEIVTALERLGFVVDRVSAAGFPDLVLSRNGNFWLAECKTGKGRLTKSQTYFHGRHKAKVPVFRRVEDVLEWSATV